MGDSQAKYNVWTTEESNELLKIMVDAAMRGWRDKNGVFNKKTVEKKILHALNEKLGCEKTITQYQSRLKWFKQRYNNYCKLIRHNSGFGWDSVTKKFTAKDEEWDDYFKSHPKHEHYRTDTFEDYEDLRIAVGTGTATGKYSIGLGDDTDARTFDIEENRETNLLDDYPRSSEVPPTTKKRDRTEFEAKSSTFKNTDPNYICEISHTLEKDCIRAIDGTHIPAIVFGHDTNSYRNRHETISQNILAACNFDLEFIYVLSGWEGSAHDSNILTDALSRNNGLKVPQGKFFLVDCGYANRRQFLALFRSVRYHLQEFTGQGRHPEDAKELFNLRHASLRNVIERIFGIFKSRFKIFKIASPFPYTTHAELVLACAGLHNFLRKECRSDVFPVEPENEVPQPSSEQIYEDNNFDKIFGTEEQQRANANAWRDTIANRTWSDVDHIHNNEP
ncbi:uncharacterized protein LOC142519816 [Primulina tabacum]|uniref:uncharacterized protein LOC142519816 n=1 Tax=Primulina tabacum TaxID=48773 RepID=UPI003F598563